MCGTKKKYFFLLQTLSYYFEKHTLDYNYTQDQGGS